MDLKQTVTTDAIDKPEVKQWIATIACCFGMAIAGVSFAWMAPLIVLLEGPESPVRMTVTERSWLSSVVEIGEIMATIPSGIYADKFGRKTTLLLSGPLSLFCWLLLIVRKSLILMFIARFLQGVVVAIIFTVTPTYLAEISQPNIRGTLISVTQVFWNFGIIWTYITGPNLNYTLYLFTCSLMSIIFLVAFYLMPESPYYWIMKDKFENARKSLSWLRGDVNINQEFSEIKANVGEEMLQKATYMDLFATEDDRRIFWIVQVVCLVRYMNGMAVVMLYSTYLFNLSESTVSPNTVTILLGLVVLISSIVAVFLADTTGRRTLILWSTVGTAVFNAIIAIYLFMDIKTKYKVSKHVWIIVAAFVGFCIVCTIGLGSMMLTIQAEYFPSHTRAIAGGVTEMGAGLGAFLNIIGYEFITKTLGLYWNYIIYTIISITGAIILYKVLPETAGTTLYTIRTTITARPSKYSALKNTKYKSIN